MRVLVLAPSSDIIIDKCQLEYLMLESIVSETARVFPETKGYRGIDHGPPQPQTIGSSRYRNRIAEDEIEIIPLSLSYDPYPTIYVPPSN